jgi:hypothetical protein
MKNRSAIDNHIIAKSLQYHLENKLQLLDEKTSEVLKTPEVYGITFSAVY